MNTFEVDNQVNNYNCEVMLNSGAVDRYRKKKKKYYVEIWDYNREGNDYPYLMQTKWYDTIEECYDFLELFDYFDNDLRFSLMSSYFDNNGEYGDIECEEEDMVFSKNKRGK